MTGLDGTCEGKLSVLTADDEVVLEFQIEKMITKFDFVAQSGLVVDMVFSREVYEEDVEASFANYLSYFRFFYPLASRCHLHKS